MRTLDESISEVSRELQVRRRCYSRWVLDGKLSQVDADDRLERLDAAHNYLREYKEILQQAEELRKTPQKAKSELDSTVQEV